MSKSGKRVVVLERRSHIGGNCYTENVDGINVHEYGAHIFRTSRKSIWDYICQFADFNHFVNSPVAICHGRVYNMPFNMNTFNRIWGVVTPDEAKAKIEEQRRAVVGEPRDLEEKAIKFIHRRFDDADNKQGMSVVNYTDKAVPYTRNIENKHFEFGEQRFTIVSEEYPFEWHAGVETYYPINDDKNHARYRQYEVLAKVRVILSFVDGLVHTVTLICKIRL